jgi:hypothetical protein
MGNHDNRVALCRFLLSEAPSMAPLDRVRVIDGLRASSPWIPQCPDFIMAM